MKQAVDGIVKVKVRGPAFVLVDISPFVHQNDPSEKANGTIEIEWHIRAVYDATKTFKCAMINQNKGGFDYNPRKGFWDFCKNACGARFLCAQGKLPDSIAWCNRGFCNMYGVSSVPLDDRESLGCVRCGVRFACYAARGQDIDAHHQETATRTCNTS